MATDLENAIEKVLQDFKIQTLKEEQKDILLTALNNKDCMAILPTGYGKSLPYQMLIPVRKQLQIQRSPDLDSYNVGKIIVCSPLIALMQDQVDRLNSIPNVKAVYKGESKDSDHIIAEGKFDYLIASPEVLVGNSGFRRVTGKTRNPPIFGEYPYRRGETPIKWWKPHKIEQEAVVGPVGRVINGAVEGLRMGTGWLVAGVIDGAEAGGIDEAAFGMGAGIDGADAGPQ
ncbi:uncharacterized protein LOC134279954, partial [Saccostrea cucullata]|uniref:uncharacterized protein LOC134279954 n=1 Tax=Saccostrea cuccullata TaxID=36930 RepID=UPI002ED31848